MTRRGWVLFAAMAMIWEIPYFLIRVAVKEIQPSVVVFGRTSLAAIVLLVLAGEPARSATRPPPALSKQSGDTLAEACRKGLLAPAIHVDLPHNG